VAIRPPASILDFLNKTAFPGYASLMPVALMGIYAPQLGRWTAAATLLAGTMLVFAESAGMFSPPVPAALFNAGAQFLVMIVGFWMSRPTVRLRMGNTGSLRLNASIMVIVVAGFLGVDFWNYGLSPQVILGLPGWVVYHAALTLGLSAAFWVVAKVIPADR